MTINLNAANLQASQIAGYAFQLRNARNKLLSYKTSITVNWQGTEVSYIIQAIDKVVSEIDNAINQLISLSVDMEITAVKIKQEDDAAAAKAAALRQQKIRTAENNYNNAENERNDLYEEKDVLEKLLNDASTENQKNVYQKQLDELNKRIEEAEEKRAGYYNILVAARK